MSTPYLSSPSWQPELPDAQLRYYQNFLSSEVADHYYEALLKNIPWQQDNVKVFGEVYAQPRLTSLHSNSLDTYTYSGLTLKPHLMIPELLELLYQIQRICNHDFNCVLLNLYRDGADSNGWHADNEKELGKQPQIASFSLGASRFFHFKHRRIKEEKYKMELHHGSLLLMEGAMQEHWLHQIPKTKKLMQPRINLTFRKII
ncbi:MAG: alpha-ketoglutarate-dependent dioxygenase AlkB [Flavobacteriaceae bacterium]|nr:alpha-ketoglutarate-dependent dioxygenase AlkB [Flavobacteriaceae bacterium]MDG1965932.1 alpha-ketoglutarate-dependent dioxygenase AlkB [Flavobacteriaceae bacterium]